MTNRTIPSVNKEMRNRPYSKDTERKYIIQETEKFTANGGKITYQRDNIPTYELLLSEILDAYNMNNPFYKR